MEHFPSSPVFMLGTSVGIFVLAGLSLAAGRSSAQPEQRFDQLLQSEYFVDKTKLINEFIKCGDDFVMVTAPKKFGKSTNLHMLKLFLEIEVDESGDKAKDVTQTRNYKLFMNRRPSLLISCYEEVVEHNLGQYPVIYVDFKIVSPLISAKDLYDSYRLAIHRAYTMHPYLAMSERLSGYDRKCFQSFLDDNTYRNISDFTVELGLTDLARYLHKHFDSEVVVLIDEYDSPITKSVASSLMDVRSVLEHHTYLLSTVLKGNPYVHSGFVTGRFCISSEGLSSVLNNVKHCEFLGKHKFNEYFGLTSDETELLLEKQCINETTKDAIISWYGGYLVPNEVFKLFSIWSVRRYLETGKIRNYWEQTGWIRDLGSVFKTDIIKEYIERLLDGDSILILINPETMPADFGYTQKFIRESNNSSDFEENLFFNFLFAQGYLTYKEHPTESDIINYLTIPNQEMVSEIKEKL